MITFAVVNKVISFVVVQENPVSFIAGGNAISFTVNTGSVIITASPIEEELVGAIDGVNKVFTTTKDFREGSTRVFINGLKQRNGIDYIETDSNEITFSDAPDSSGFEDFLLINYIEV